MHEQRLTVRMVKLWEKLAELNPPPMYAHLNRAAISDIWQQCAVLKIEPYSKEMENPVLGFEFIGETVKKLLPGLKEGQNRNLNMMERELKKLLQNLPDVISQVQTVINDGTLVSKNSKVIKYRVCLLPFTDNTGAVVNIVVGFSWIEC